MGLTQTVAHFVTTTRFRDLPHDVVQLAQGFVLDGLGVALAGSTDECARIIHAQMRDIGGRAECSVLGTLARAPAPRRPRNGVAGHAMDYDDTQFSTPRKPFTGCSRILRRRYSLRLSRWRKRKESGRELSRLHFRRRGRVPHRRCDQSAPLPVRFSLDRYDGRDWAAVAAAQKFAPEGGCFAARIRDRGKHVIRIARKFRNDDQTIACRPGGAKRRDGRAAWTRRLYCRCIIFSKRPAVSSMPWPAVMTRTKSSGVSARPIS